MFENTSICLRSMLLMLLGACAAPQARGATIAVPNALATTDGNFFHDGGPVPVRVMQIYDASQFAGLPGPILITQLNYRPDSIPDASGPRSLDVEVFASTTSRTVAGMSGTFAENIGPDNTLVFSGTHALDTGNLAGPGNTRQFDIDWPLTTPFLYDPRAGNLVLDFQASGGGGPLVRRDAVMGNPSVNFVAALGSPAAPTGNVLGFGFVTEFTYQLVPEPSACGLAGVAALIVFVNARRRRTCKFPLF
jgi:hypothetical protein